jgi:C-terminal processing protease CtpA/Prc
MMRSVLKNVSSEINKNFYDSSLKGLDWKALTEETRQRIDRAKSLNEMEAAVFEMVEKLDDSHTFFIPPESSIEVKYGFNVKPYGDEIRVYDVDAKGAAAIAGLQVGDKVVQIAGTEAKRDSVFHLLAEMKLLYTVSPLNMLVQRQGQGYLQISITPRIITRPVVTTESQIFAAFWALVMDDYSEWQKRATFMYGSSDGVGYFQVRQFPSQGGDFLTGLAQKTQASKALIIDLRDCPGGSVDTLLSFAGLFQDTDSEMGSAIERKKTKPLKIKARKPYFKVPLFILVDSTTASAAEMITRHLQRNRKAIVIGDRTLGAVTMATEINGEVGAGMITYYGINVGMAKIVLSDGEVLEKKGITPDIACLPSQEDMRQKKDPCLALALKMAKANSSNPIPN